MRLSDIEPAAHQAAIRARDEAAGWFHPHPATEASPMTETTVQPAITDPATNPAAAPSTFLGLLHHNLSTFTAVIGRLLPRLERIAANPKLDAAVEALLTADGACVAAEVFEFVTGALNSAAAAKTAPADGQTAQTPAATS